MLLEHRQTTTKPEHTAELQKVSRNSGSHFLKEREGVFKCHLFVTHHFLVSGSEQKTPTSWLMKHLDVTYMSVLQKGKLSQGILSE